MSKTYVGSRLRQLRSEKGLSQVALARSLEISASYLNQIENDVRPLTVSVLLLITEVFGNDTTFFAPRDNTRLIAEVREVLLDGQIDNDQDAAEIAKIDANHPELVHA